MATDYNDNDRNSIALTKEMILEDSVTSITADWITASTIMTPFPTYNWGRFTIAADRFLTDPDINETIRQILKLVQPTVLVTVNSLNGDRMYIVRSAILPTPTAGVPNTDYRTEVIPEYPWLAYPESVLLYKKVNGY